MLDLLFRPRSLGIIGVSSEPLSIGRRILQNLLDHGYRGQIHLITPRAAAIGSFRTYPSILNAPGDIDLVNIAVRSELIPGILEECGRKGVRFAVIHAAGFKEAGEEGRALEDRILSIARAFGMRLCGPNSQGVQMSDPSFPVYANFTFVPMIPGNISILAQSGGVGETLKLHLFRAGLGLRMYAGYGNESDLGLNEFLDHCGRDPGTRAIMLHVETFKDPAGFLDVASRISAGKPILALKTGRTPEGTRAAASHTGVLVEPDDLAEAVFDKSGVLSFRTQEEIIGAAAAFSMQPCPKGRRVAVLTNTGGPAVIAIDECVAAGLRPADLGPETRPFPIRWTSWQRRARKPSGPQWRSCWPTPMWIPSSSSSSPRLSSTARRSLSGLPMSPRRRTRPSSARSSLLIRRARSSGRSGGGAFRYTSMRRPRREPWRP
jgi:acetyltransferase